MIRKHDRNAFLVFAYNDGAPETARNVKADYVRDTAGLDDKAFADLIVADQIDILVEVNGFVPGNRYKAMMHHPAKIQVNWGNYPCTTGLQCIDYQISDKCTVPTEHWPYYTEKIIHVRNQCLSCDFNNLGFPDPSPPPLIRNGYPTFGCFSSSHKHNPATAKIWSGVLSAFPDARFIIKALGTQHEQIRSNLHHMCVQAGIPAESVEVREPSDHKAMLGEYADIDIALDTFPATGGSTMCEALWQGLPVISLKGDRYCSRQGASILATAGLEEYIATDPANMRDIAVQLVSDSDKLVELRKNQRDTLMKTRFVGTEKSCAQFEKAYKEMIRELDG